MRNNKHKADNQRFITLPPDAKPYIDLKDKNGVELYLGDDFIFLVDINVNYQFVSKPKSKIIFNLGSFGFIVNNKFFTLYEWITKGSLTLISDCIQEIEVINAQE